MGHQSCHIIHVSPQFYSSSFLVPFPRSKKIPTTFEQTNVSNLYAIGDVIEESSATGRVLELTPVAVKAGQLLAKRLYGSSDIKVSLNDLDMLRLCLLFTVYPFGHF